jgi:lipoyl(octanoyl) transferase
MSADLAAPTIAPLGVRRMGCIRYSEGAKLQAQLVRARQDDAIPDTLLLLEHSPVFTLGQNAKRENVLLPADLIRARGFDVEETGRGGDVTYHGPGQIVAYPVLQLTGGERDVHVYLRNLEEAMIRTCADFGLRGRRIDGLTGVWIEDRKIGAIGVRVARWVTSHGLALNVNLDLEPFRMIVPCGLRGRGVTSVAQELGYAPSVSEAMDGLTYHLAATLGRTLAL